MNKLYRVNDIENNLRIARFRPLDILLVGGTGAGKSSTINSIFENEVASVGRGCDPETMTVTSRKLNDLLRFWDSPGLGDDVEKDKLHARKLMDMLYKDYTLDDKRYGLIDTVLVILDGSLRDMGTTYRLLNEVIVPNFQPERILVAINQADMAMKGRHWDENQNAPDMVLHEFLEEKACSVRNRIKEATNVWVPMPVYFSAERNYNTKALLDTIVDHMPRERRNLVVQ